jgi:uncharacterized membrane protein
MAAAGALDALVFLLAGHRRLDVSTRWLPEVCRVDGSRGPRVVDTPYARVLGVNNSALGFLFYAAAGAAGLAAVLTGSLPFCVPLLLAGAAAVALSAYLAWVLLAKLRTTCLLCFLGHGLNAGILVSLLALCVP